VSIITDYATLQATIADYAHRTDLDGVIPGFIQLAEERINSDLRVPAMQASEVLSPTSDVSALPERFNGVRSLTGTHGGRSYALKNVAPDISTNYLNNTGSPALVYALLGSQIQIPQGTGATFQLDFWQNPEALASVASNDVLLAYPSLYLYASLAEVGAYTQDGQYKIEAENTYQAILNKANADADEIRYGSAPQMSNC
jgi:hypothetical protein